MSAILSLTLLKTFKVTYELHVYIRKVILFKGAILAEAVFSRAVLARLFGSGRKLLKNWLCFL